MGDTDKMAESERIADNQLISSSGINALRRDLISVSVGEGHHHRKRTRPEEDIN